MQFVKALMINLSNNLLKKMKDTNFEKYSRAHSFWQEWQGAADRAGDVDTYLDDLIAATAPQWQGIDTDEFMNMVRGREPETFSEAVSASSPDWNFVINGQVENDLVINLT